MSVGKRDNEKVFWMVWQMADSLAIYLVEKRGWTRVRLMDGQKAGD